MGSSGNGNQWAVGMVNGNDSGVSIGLQRVRMFANQMGSGQKVHGRTIQAGGGSQSVIASSGILTSGTPETIRPAIYERPFRERSYGGTPTGGTALARQAGDTRSATAEATAHLASGCLGCARSSRGRGQSRRCAQISAATRWWCWSALRLRQLRASPLCAAMAGVGAPQEWRLAPTGR